MKLLIVISIILTGSLYEACAQKLTFTYDSAGNQIKRQRILTVPLASQEVSKQKKIVDHKTDQISSVQKAKLVGDNARTTSVPIGVARSKKRDYNKKAMP